MAYVDKVKTTLLVPFGATFRLGSLAKASRSLMEPLNRSRSTRLLIPGTVPLSANCQTAQFVQPCARLGQPTPQLAAQSEFAEKAVLPTEPSQNPRSEEHTSELQS